MKNMETSYFIWIIFFGSWLTVTDSYLTADERYKFVPENHKNWENLDHKTCGFSMKDRIIGGRDAGLGKYPWVVRLGGPSRYGDLFFSCGGTILNRFFVLTAAHCFGKPITPTVVRVGEYDATKDPDCNKDLCASPVQDIRILRYVTPWYYTPHTFENDIALIELAKPIEFSETVLPICLPPYSVSRSNMIGKIVEVAGWGLIDIYTRETPDILQGISLRIVNNIGCRRYRAKHTRFPFNMICASAGSGKGTCSGDSGGPLMLPEESEGTMRYYIIGIVSYGPEYCEQSNSPGVYTFVPQYQRWLLNLIYKK